jgi:hypothetical protein
MTEPDDLFRHDDEQTHPDHLLDQRERDLEVSTEDLAEQEMPADPVDEREEPAHIEPEHLDDEVNEWDAIEQARIVDLEEEHR